MTDLGSSFTPRQIALAKFLHYKFKERGGEESVESLIIIILDNIATISDPVAVDAYNAQKEQEEKAETIAYLEAKLNDLKKGITP